MFEQAFNNIDQSLRNEAGCQSELDYTEQTSWLLFLKYLDDLEQDRADHAKVKVHDCFEDKQEAFIDFVLGQYVVEGVDELDLEKLPDLLRLKYHAVADAIADLGTVEQIKKLFAEFQQFLYQEAV